MFLVYLLIIIGCIWAAWETESEHLKCIFLALAGGITFWLFFLP